MLNKKSINDFEGGLPEVEELIDTLSDQLKIKKSLSDKRELRKKINELMDMVEKFVERKIYVRP